MKISIVVPCFNEEASLPELVTRVQDQMGTSEYELILVDDGSSDGTGELVRSLAAEDSRIQAVQLCRNFGQTAAICAGVDAASGDVIVPMDADLQNDPKDIPRLIEKLEEGYDVVSGWRRDRRDHWSRVLPSRVANVIISWMSGVKLHDYGCTLKAYRRRMFRADELYGEMHRFIPIYAYWNGARITEITVTHHPRKRGRSHYGFGRIVSVPLDLLVVSMLGNYATKPIHLFGQFGGALAVLGTICISVTVYNRLFEQIYVKDQPLFLAGIFLWLVATQLVLLGLVAELVIRVYHRGQDNRPYRIKDEEWS